MRNVNDFVVKWCKSCWEKGKKSQKMKLMFYITYLFFWKKNFSFFILLIWNNKLYKNEKRNENNFIICIIEVIHSQICQEGFYLNKKNNYIKCEEEYYCINLLVEKTFLYLFEKIFKKCIFNLKWKISEKKYTKR